MKSARLHIAAKIVLFVGLIACVLGCAAYCVLAMPEVMNLEFKWEYLAVDGAALILFVLVALLLGALSKSAAKKEAKAAEWAEQNAEAALADASAEEDAAEAVDAPEDVPAEVQEAAEAGTDVEIKNENRLTKLCAKVGIPENVVNQAERIGKIAAPAVLGCVFAAIVSAKANQAKHKKNRQQFYKWLG